MNGMKWDKIICRGLTFECEIGFHSVEKKTKQKISIDLEAWVLPLSPNNADKVRAIRMDYYKANRLLLDLFQKNNFKLIETASDTAAALILKTFDVHAVQVSLTKFPLDMPNMGSVTYQCHRERE